jgi:cysteine desulfurase
MIYFDNASTTQIPHEIIPEFLNISKTIFGNPSSQHGLGQIARKYLEISRMGIAEYLKVSYESIYFNSGATEGNNTIIMGYCSLVKNPTIITTRMEHSSIYTLLNQLIKQGVKVEFIDVDNFGYIQLKHLEKLLKQYPSSLVITSPVNHELGTIQKFKEIITLSKIYGARIHFDLTQSLMNLKLNLTELDIDSAVFSTHKLYGPKGVGVLYKKIDFPIQKLVYGGKQEKNFRGGTENVSGIYGSYLAIKWLQKNNFNHLLSKYFVENIKANIPKIMFNSDISNLSSIVNFYYPGIKAITLVEDLSIHEVYVSSGAACIQGTNILSNVLETIKLQEEVIKASIRISFGIINTIFEIDQFTFVLKQSLERVSKLSK